MPPISSSFLSLIIFLSSLTFPLALVLVGYMVTDTVSVDLNTSKNAIHTVQVNNDTATCHLRAKKKERQGAGPRELFSENTMPLLLQRGEQYCRVQSGKPAGIADSPALPPLSFSHHFVTFTFYFPILYKPYVSRTPLRCSETARPSCNRIGHPGSP